MPDRTALLLGATGLVGSHCLERLLAHDAYARVVTLGRRPLECAHLKLTHHVVDFDRLADASDVMQGDDVFCCLGTTMKQAGSKEAFRRVDYAYPLEAARIAHARGAQQYLLVSATGADTSSLFFYNRVKGEVEEAIAQLDYDGFYVMRPSLLTGDRDETRWGERLAEGLLNVFSFALRGPLRRARPTPAADVAAAMVAIAVQQPGGMQVVEPDAIRQWAERAAGTTTDPRGA